MSLPAPTAEAADGLQPFLKEHCLRCHGPEKQKAKLRLDTLALPCAAHTVAELGRSVKK